MARPSGFRSPQRELENQMSLISADRPLRQPRSHYLTGGTAPRKVSRCRRCGEQNRSGMRAIASAARSVRTRSIGSIAGSANGRSPAMSAASAADRCGARPSSVGIGANFGVAATLGRICHRGKNINKINGKDSPSGDLDSRKYQNYAFLPPAPFHCTGEGVHGCRKGMANAGVSGRGRSEH